MRRLNLALLFALLLVLVCVPCWADIVLYRLPGTDVALVLQGRVTVHPGRTVTVRHPKYGALYFALKDLKIFELEPTRSIAKSKVERAVRDDDVESCLEAGRWALHHGHLPEFYDAAGAAWKLDSTHATVKRLGQLKRIMDTPIPVSGVLEDELRSFVPTARRMEMARSKHFLMLHDTSDERDKRTKKTRAEERLELLETVYACFLMKFCLEGQELEVPKKRMKVVLYGEKQDFIDFANKLSASLTSAAGFFTMKENVSIFYDQGTNEELESLMKALEVLQVVKQRAIKARAPGTADIVRLINTLQLLAEVGREELDIEVVSHEATHQMAANTGLMPAESPTPTWAAEGLATYFESPKQAAWSGIGTVNEQRLAWYRELASGDNRPDVEQIVSNRIFMESTTLGEAIHAYGQSWALTHFLMDQHFDELMNYYALIAEIESEEMIEADENIALFQEAFGDDMSRLDLEWRSYMRSLKTDLERVLAEED